MRAQRTWRLVLAACALALPPGAAVAQAAPAEVTETVISPDVVSIRGRSENMVAVRTDAGLVVVDSLISPLHARLARARLAARFPGQPVRYLISTHYHPDHNFGAQEYPEAILIAHVRNAARAPDTRTLAEEYLRAPEELARLRARMQPGAAPDAALAADIARWETRNARYAGFKLRSADLQVAGGLTIVLGGKTIDIRHPGPGHTDGDLVVHFVEDRVLATGDRVFNHIVPVIDLDGGVDIKGWSASLESRFGLAGRDFTVVPGHGAVGGPELLAEQARYLNDLVAAVSAARIADERALEAAKATFTLPGYADYEPTFGDHAGNFEAVWRLLEGRNAPPAN
jgi:glyoxylase-like metal-dependent hydrolase (beta-lactamase superfamily II)